MFNTHPYLASSVIGSAAGMEEEGVAPEEVEDLKKALMGPYAAIGDSFFWGALRSVSGVGAVILAFSGTLLAPLPFLLLYTPAQLWVRGAGFLEGYRRRRNGIDFIRKLDLPGATGKVRLLLLAVAVETAGRFSLPVLPELPLKAAAALLLLLIFFAIRKGISQVGILYGIAIICMVVSF
jgi:PTS system mannose-specific IID component